MTALAFMLWQDRANVIHDVEQAASNSVRLIAAHGDAALGEARQLVAAVEPELSNWDGADEVAALELHESLRDQVQRSPRIAAAWVKDAEGNSLLDSWSFPAEPVSASDRTYFQRHLAGEDDPVIAGSQRGSVSGVTRFTYSEAIRDAQGALQAVIVVGLHTSTLTTLYQELAAATGASSGLYKVRGDVLAQSAGAETAGLRTKAMSLTSEVGVRGVTISEAPNKQIIAWQGSREFPGVVALSAMDLSKALAAWRTRAATMALLGAALLALMLLLARSLSRMQAEREKAAQIEFASREVQHRVKNSLQLISSFIRLRARRATNDETVIELGLIGNQLQALAGIQELLEVADTPGMVEMTSVLDRLRRQIEASHGATVSHALDGTFLVDSATAGRLAIITNELITNALKHGDGKVRLEAENVGRDYRICVSNGGSALADGFDMEAQQGFGLKSARALAESLGGTLIATNGGPFKGVQFQLSVPIGNGAAAA